jgi:hypothetical protein
MGLRRYWITFARHAEFDHPAVMYGVGVTAWDSTDAMDIVRTTIFTDRELPRVESVTEDIDISTLDEGHVRPNMALPFKRGVWFPLGYES